MQRDRLSEVQVSTLFLSQVSRLVLDHPRTHSAERIELYSSRKKSCGKGPRGKLLEGSRVRSRGWQQFCKSKVQLTLTLEIFRAPGRSLRHSILSFPSLFAPLCVSVGRFARRQSLRAHRNERASSLQPVKAFNVTNNSWVMRSTSQIL